MSTWGTAVVWGDEVDLTTTAFRTRVGKCIVDRVAACRAWAADRGETMAPFFETRTVTGGIIGESYTAVGLPVACLAEYENDDLVHVTPYRAGEPDEAVTDRLEYPDNNRSGHDGAVGGAVQERPYPHVTGDAGGDADSCLRCPTGYPRACAASLRAYSRGR